MTAAQVPTLARPFSSRTGSAGAEIDGQDGPSVIRRFLDGDDSAEFFLPDPQWGPNGKVVYERTYSRKKADGSKETWAQTCRRVVNGNLAYAPKHTWLPNEDVDLFEAMYSFGIVPAGRHLAATGTKAAATRNCWVAGFSSRTSDHFRWAASRLFEGGGLGTNASNDLLAVTAPVTRAVEITVRVARDHPDVIEVFRETLNGGGLPTPGGMHPDFDHVLYRVEDTREGWVDAYGTIIDIATGQYEGDLDSAPGQPVHVVLDVSDIRPYGSELRTMGGTASGPAPLAKAASQISRVLSEAAAEHRRLGAIETHLIDHFIAASVVAGGARRSARMAMLNWRDDEIFDFIHMKSDSQYHWTTNISVEIGDDFYAALSDPNHDLHDHADRVLTEVARGMARNGEPGIVDTDKHSIGERARIRATNPCGEIGLSARYDADGNAQGEACNLGAVNLDRYGTNDADIHYAMKLTGRFLYRATLHHPHPDPLTYSIEERNRRTGGGFMGLQGWTAAHGVKLSALPEQLDLQAKLAEFKQTAVQAENDLADELGTPRPVKYTAIAPTGTTAMLSGTTPGISPVYARYAMRNVRFGAADPAVAELKAKGHKVEPDEQAANTVVVSFPQRDPLVDRFGDELIEQADEIDAVTYWKICATVQENFLTDGVGNAVSGTATLPTGASPDDVKAMLRELLLDLRLPGNADPVRLKGITMFPSTESGETAIAQPPFQTVSKQDYEDAVRRLEGIEDHELVGEATDGQCAGGACPVV